MAKAERQLQVQKIYKLYIGGKFVRRKMGTSEIKRRHEKMDAELIGRASVLLGGGRQKPGAAIDFAVGLSNIKKVDERIERGDPLLLIHARNDATIRSVLPLLKSDRGCLKAPECFCDPPDPIKPHHAGY